MKIKNLLLFLLFPFFSFCFSGQDTLVFTNLKNPGKIFRLPLAAYPLKVKLKKGKTIKAIITAYTDTSLTLKVWTFKKRNKELRKKIFDVRTNKSLTTAQADSLQNLIKYSSEKSIYTRDIKCLKINNSYRRELKKKLRILEIVMVSTLVVFIFLPLVAGLSLTALYFSLFLLLLAEWVYSFIARHTRIELEHKWKIKQ